MRTAVGMFVGLVALAGLMPDHQGAAAHLQVASQAPTPPPEFNSTPYAAAAEHLWNRLHRALFVRTVPGGKPRVHQTDPLLYHGITRERNGVLTYGTFFLLQGESHDRAVLVLDQFLADRGERIVDDPVKRLFLQRDLWAAFDYASWYPNEWVYHTRHLPAAIALRTRLAKAVNRLSLSESQIKELPDNYAMAVKSKQYAAEHDPEHPERPFLPSNLFDPSGPWYCFHDAQDSPMTSQHFEGAGGRAVHYVFLRLPGGRAATEQYLKALENGPIKQFPPGTMVAMVRRALAVDQSIKVRVTPVTELVQIRVYRRIPNEPTANKRGDFGAQDVYEFVLDRDKLFVGQHGLRATGPDDPAESFSRGVGEDPFDPIETSTSQRSPKPEAQMKTCIQCHQQPGVYSIMSMQKGLVKKPRGEFRTHHMGWTIKATLQSKVRRFEWGLLQGMIEATREQVTQERDRPVQK
ncbi:hypothetical protein BH10PLA2_BH10PLA2_39550 [soil metagenome]